MRLRIIYFTCPWRKVQLTLIRLLFLINIRLSLQWQLMMRLVDLCMIRRVLRLSDIVRSLTLTKLCVFLTFLSCWLILQESSLLLFWVSLMVYVSVRWPLILQFLKLSLMYRKRSLMAARRRPFSSMRMILLLRILYLFSGIIILSLVRPVVLMVLRRMSMFSCYIIRRLLRLRRYLVQFSWYLLIVLYWRCLMFCVRRKLLVRLLYILMS